MEVTGISSKMGENTQVGEKIMPERNILQMENMQIGGMMTEVTGISSKMGENIQVGEKIMLESITM